MDEYFGNESTAPFRLVTLGGLTLETSSGEVLSGIPRGRLAILAAIACGMPQGVSRDVLLCRFWPESDAERSRAALRQALYALRQATGMHDLTLGTSELRLNPVVVTADVQRYLRALAERRDELAVSLYRGAFLEGVHLSANAEYDAWVESERRRLRAGCDRALERLAMTSTARGAHDEAAQWWRQLLDANPLNSKRAMALIASLNAAGRRHEGVQVGKRIVMLLEEELGAGAGREVAGAVAALEAVQAHAGTTGALDDGPTDCSAVSGIAPAEPQLSLRESLGNEGQVVRRRHWRLRKTLGTIAAAAMTVLIGGRALLGGDLSRQTEGRLPMVEVSEFVNRTGSRELEAIGAMPADWISRGLERTGLVNVEAGGSGRASDKRGTAGVEFAGGVQSFLQALRIRRSPATFIRIEGTLFRSGDSVLVSVRARSSDGSWIERLEPIVVDERNPLPGIEQVRQRVLGTIATRSNPLMRNWIPMAQKPTSFESYERFARGLELFFQDQKEAADSEFVVAYRNDTTFVSPLLWALFDSNAVMPYERHQAVIAALMQRREQLAPLDRAMLDMQRASDRREREQEFEAAQHLMSLSPGSEWAYMAAFTARDTDRPQLAARILEGIDPTTGWLRFWPGYYDVLADAHHALGRFEQELADWRTLAKRFPSLVDSAGNLDRWNEVTITRPLAALGRISSVDSILVDLGSLRDESGIFSTAEAYHLAVRELRAHFDVRVAKQLVSRFEQWWVQLPEQLRQRCSLLGSRIQIAMDLGKYEEAYAVAASIRSRCTDRDTVRWRIISSGFTGRAAEADSLIQAQRATYVGSTWDDISERANLDFCDAQIAALQGRTSDAIRLLQRATVHGDPLGLFDRRYEPGLERLRGNPAFEAMARPKG